MNHQQYQEMALLSLYGELTAGDQQKLDRHLVGCDRCQAELEDVKLLHKTLAAHKKVSVRERDLVDARRSLRVALGGPSPTVNWVERIIEIITIPLVPQYRTLISAAATLAIGIGLGYYFFGSSEPMSNGVFRVAAETEQAAFDQGEARVANFRFITKDEATGNVEFQFDATTPVRIRGNVKTDERVQKILARAAVSAENPGARLRAVNAISEHATTQHPITNDVKMALISVVKYDENRGVRQQSLKALEKFLPDPDVVEAFVYALKTEKNTGMKIAAINGLANMKFTGQSVDEELLNVLREKVQSDENNYIRIKAKATLQEVRQQ